MGKSEYVHPASGRTYREGDPAHRFAQMAHALRSECEQFLHYFDRVDENAETDYLRLLAGWQSDPERIARSMRETLKAIDQAYSDVVADRDAYRYGIGKQDDEWHRKYGDPAARSPQGETEQ